MFSFTTVIFGSVIVGGLFLYKLPGDSIEYERHHYLRELEKNGSSNKNIFYIEYV